MTEPKTRVVAHLLKLEGEGIYEVPLEASSRAIMVYRFSGRLLKAPLAIRASP